MYATQISTLDQYLKIIEPLTSSNDILLFRGQDQDKPLLPSIARDDKRNDESLVKTEEDMLRELKRRAPLLLSREPKTDWEWLVIAQHFGLRTRLLDWSSNPLIALWFACRSLSSTDSVIYILEASKNFLVDYEANESPFKITHTRILRPPMNNDRIVAQAGWFTVHKCSSKLGKFIPLEENADMKHMVRKVIVKPNDKITLIQKVSILGINNQSIYPDIEGLCRHLNTSYFN
ncbi:FRG domain-containing protein [Dyadobacter psychrophilus]|uniref:FRG domain-containing protein n=1 Tax=Dyadobacter psychrophilus TaxID=651661 RepID=A0A1T5HG01_9BACT|nr:FRG domain-containing protein [Dyadobacter psychrophilus]SKC19608.1 FRG domain-containing protein [Dyadobacter psychrophilus]